MYRRHIAFFILLALIFGSLIGIFMPQQAVWFAWMGQVFKLSLAMIVVPIVLTSIIVGMASVGDIRKLGSLGGKTISYYMGTTLIAVSIGVALVSFIQPGVRAIPKSLAEKVQDVKIKDTKTLVAEINTIFQNDNSMEFSKNELQDLSSVLVNMANQGESEQAIKTAATRLAGSLDLRQQLDSDKKLAPVKAPSAKEFFDAQIAKILVNPFKALHDKNVLAIIFFALLFGGALTTLGQKGQQVFEIFKTVNTAITKIVSLIMYFAPLGVMGLMADVVSSTGTSVFSDLGKYAFCVLLGLACHGLIILPSLVYFFAGIKPMQFLSGIKQALAIAFSTSSSNATLPITLKTVESNFKVNKRVTRFVLPLGATINMDGTALYEAIAAVFIAQLYGVSLGLSGQITVALTAALAAVGTAAIPAAGTVTMALVLSAVGLPLEAIGLLLAVDRPLDMCRTTINVIGDTAGSIILSSVSSDAEKEYIKEEEVTATAKLDMTPKTA